MTVLRGAATDLRAVALPWITARVLVGIGFVVAMAVADRLVPGNEPTALTEGLVAWDGTWYRDIADVGYQALPDEGLRFFPLFPLLGRFLSPLMLGRGDVALVIVANLASLALAVGVRRLVLFERGNTALADRAVWFTALFPGAFVLSWAYAEALWMLAAVVLFWAARSRHWWWAAGAGLVAGGTRPLGILLAVVVVIELARVWRRARNDERIAGVVAALAPALGSGAYLLWVGAAYGDPWLPLSVQSPLRGDSTNPFARVWDGLGQMVGPEALGDGLHIPFALAFVVLLVLVWRWWPASYGAFATALLVVALAAENLNSLERYALSAFPLALALAGLTRDDRVERVALTALAGGMVALSSMAWLGTYVP
ncbi:hypothetical protein [Rhabdothermincola salaria]|uniref:hypothetical protein n=1 Tax=Rhabdothermincola salaria TaxID=2903142 RepID=UPI001E65D115|nr:hypothetical protein [Rhabdothermincola salaria]MCD9623006.1 hypothetical protein [Rhabdothermincola salaria]